MAKRVIGNFDFEEEGDLIDHVAKMQEKNRQEITQIKERVDFLRLLTWLGLSVKKNGKGHMACCPFHDDKTPSLSIDPVKKVFHCFGCGKSGDIITFVQEYHKVSFKEAVAVLKNYQSGPALPQPAEKPKAKEKPKPTTVLSAEETRKLFKSIVETYHKALLADTSAQEYLKSRGLLDHQLIDRFQLGYSDGKSLLKKCSQAQKQALKQIGIADKYGREHFAGCVVIPVFSPDGTVGELYGRRITDKDPRHLYLPGPHEGVFNLEAFKVYDSILITESLLDALSLFRLGLQNVTACFGSGGFTGEMLTVIKTNNIQEVVIAYDNDEPGRAASAKLKEKLVNENLVVREIFPQEHKDWNEALTAGLSKQTVITLIEEAQAVSPPAKNKKPFCVEKKGLACIITLGEIRYRIKGVPKLFVTSLRVNIKAEYEGKKYLDTADICTARGRKSYGQEASMVLGVSDARITEDLLTIVNWLEEEMETESSHEEVRREYTAEEKELGMSLLLDEAITETVLADIEMLGYVGEEMNKLLMYLIATSRKMYDPISGLIVAQSGSGKSRLVETVQKLIPPEEVVETTSVSDQAFNYVTEGGLVNKFLILGEAVHSDVVEHQIRDMLSNKKLSRLVTIKDKTTGEMVGKNITTKVVVASAQTTTRHNINPENASRCFIINTDESREQTRRIHSRQNKKYTPEYYREKKVVIPKIILKHQVAQTLLTPRVIFNPYTESIHFPNTIMRLRRDYERFLDLIATVCYLRQYQKEPKTGIIRDTGEKYIYIECDLKDYRIAYRIIQTVLPGTLSSLPSGSVLLYEELLSYCREKAEEQKINPADVKFTQRQISEAKGLQLYFIKRYIKVLCGYEYIAKTGGYRGGTNIYHLVKDEELKMFDISMIPSPEEVASNHEKWDKKAK